MVYLVASAASATQPGVPATSDNALRIHTPSNDSCLAPRLPPVCIRGVALARIGPKPYGCQSALQDLKRSSDAAVIASSCLRVMPCGAGAGSRLALPAADAFVASLSVPIALYRAWRMAWRSHGCVLEWTTWRESIAMARRCWPVVGYKERCLVRLGRKSISNQAILRSAQRQQSLQHSERLLIASTSSLE